MTTSMTCEQFEEILPQLLDDETSAIALTPIVRAHLDGCVECRLLLDDLTAIRSKAAALPALVPSRDLWSGIAARIEAPVVPLVEGVGVRPIRRQLSWRTAGLVAAGLVALTTAVTYRLARRDVVASPATVATVPARTTDTAHTVIAQAPAMEGVKNPAPSTIVLASNNQGQPRKREGKVEYDREVARLRAIVDSGRTRLDPATVAILDRNLRVIDLAIEQCNQALTRDSASTFLIESLNNAYQTKVKLLRMAAAAASRG